MASDGFVTVLQPVLYDHWHLVPMSAEFAEMQHCKALELFHDLLDVGRQPTHAVEMFFACRRRKWNRRWSVTIAIVVYAI